MSIPLKSERGNETYQFFHLTINNSSSKQSLPNMYTIVIKIVIIGSYDPTISINNFNINRI